MQIKLAVAGSGRARKSDVLEAVMRELDLTPGPIVGKIMKELYEQRINEGLVSVEEALELAKKIKEESS